MDVIAALFHSEPDAQDAASEVAAEDGVIQIELQRVPADGRDHGGEFIALCYLSPEQRPTVRELLALKGGRHAPFDWAQAVLSGAELLGAA